MLLNVTVERADNRELSFSNFEMATLHSTMNDLGGIRESSFIEPEPLPRSLSVSNITLDDYIDKYNVYFHLYYFIQMLYNDHMLYSGKSQETEHW